MPSIHKAASAPQFAQLPKFCPEAVVPPDAPSAGLPAVGHPKTTPQAHPSTHHSTIKIATPLTEAQFRSAASSLVSPQTTHPAHRAGPTRFMPQPLSREVAVVGVMPSQGHPRPAPRRAPRVSSSRAQEPHPIRAASQSASPVDPHTAPGAIPPHHPARQPIASGHPPMRALHFGIPAAVLASSGFPALQPSLAATAAVSSQQTGEFLSAEPAQGFPTASLQPVQPAEPEARATNFDHGDTSSSVAAEPAEFETRVTMPDHGNTSSSELMAGPTNFFARGSLVAGEGLEADAAWSIAAGHESRGCKPTADKVSHCAQGSSACRLSQLSAFHNIQYELD